MRLHGIGHGKGTLIESGWVGISLISGRVPFSLKTGPVFPQLHVFDAVSRCIYCVSGCTTSFNYGVSAMRRSCTYTLVSEDLIFPRRAVRGGRSVGPHRPKIFFAALCAAVGRSDQADSEPPPR